MNQRQTLDKSEQPVRTRPGWLKLGWLFMLAFLVSVLNAAQRRLYYRFLRLSIAGYKFLFEYWQQGAERLTGPLAGTLRFLAYLLEVTGDFEEKRRHLFVGHFHK